MTVLYDVLLGARYQFGPQVGAEERLTSYPYPLVACVGAEAKWNVQRDTGTTRGQIMEDAHNFKILTRGAFL